MQNKSVGEFSAGSRWDELYPCTCYVRLSPLIQSHRNIDNLATPSIPREERNEQIQRSQERVMATRGSSQNTREYPVQIFSFTDGGR